MRSDLNFLDLDYLEKFEEIIGCDEAGRGPLAGPVVGCALKISREAKGLLARLEEMGVCDSKKLTSAKRHKILHTLGIEVKELGADTSYTISFEGSSFEFAIYDHGPADIDRLNILQASLSCMKHAASRITEQDGEIRSRGILVDGNKGFGHGHHPVEPMVKGDQKLLCIGLASIIAKEFRDEKMKVLDQLYPGYDLAKHAGYPTSAHRAAIELLGPSPIHRKSFKGVKEHVKGSGEGKTGIS